MYIEIDEESGFCFGVVYAIQKAEEELKKDGKLYCLGDIVHNSVEVERLKRMGLKTIDHETFQELSHCKVLIRAHGEPPETYQIALKNNIELIDATCPVVLKLQKRIKNGYDDYTDIDGQLVIYGEEGHAEVNGLVGQTGNKAIVIENMDDLNKIDYTKPIKIFSQTTKSIKGFHEITDLIIANIKKQNPDLIDQFKVNDTICRQVSTRGPKLEKFAKKHDIIIFVSGKKSSNGRILYNVCKTVNKNTYFVSEAKDIQLSWFDGHNSTGICGATSTPRWLMDEIAYKIKTLIGAIE